MIPIQTVAQVREFEERLIAGGGITAEELMERAGREGAAILAREFPRAREALLLIGKGNNGGDGLVIARHLARFGWRIALAIPHHRTELGPLCGRKLDELRAEFPSTLIGPISEGMPWPHADGVVVDALLGIGAKGDLRPALDNAVKLANRKRAERFFRVAAVDGPTGLHLGADRALAADLTLCIGFGKTALLQEENADAVGRIEVVPIFRWDDSEHIPAEAVLERTHLHPLLPRRRPRSHKATFGRLVLVGGSRGTSGAPLIAATGALRAGAGLVHVAVRSEVLAETVARAPLEAMVSAAGDGADFSALLEKADVVAVGPGLGTDHDAVELLRRIQGETKAPLVIDADGLTILSQHPDLLAACRGRALLTPHPGEMGRFLGGKFPEAERAAVARAFAEEHGVVLVLKGTRTLVAAPGAPLAVNTTGNPGLAAGGSGDLLTGIVAALAGQGLKLAAAARLGVWLHGRAADLALRDRGAEEGLGPLEVTGHLAAAFADLRS